MKKHYALHVRGKRREWAFPIVADPKHVEDWREDGLVVSETLNVVPQMIVTLGLTRPWYWLQDLTGWGFG